jgi:hypothetical protein
MGAVPVWALDIAARQWHGRRTASTTDRRIAVIYSVGDVVNLRVRFEDPDTDQPLVPDTVTCQVKDPDGVITTVTPDLQADDSFAAQVQATKAGGWFFRFAGTGRVQGAVEDRFSVRPTSFRATAS